MKSTKNSGKRTSSRTRSLSLFEAYEHTDEELLNEIERLTDEVNAPSFVPDFVFSLSNQRSKKGDLSIKQLRAYYNIHQRWVLLGYMHCEVCEKLYNGYEQLILDLTDYLE